MMAESAYTQREEFVHRLTHWVGIVASLLAIPWLAWTAARHGDNWRLFSGVVFGVSALLLFVTSVRYHRPLDPDEKQRRRRLDHSAIYVLIAGTYTPFMLGVMRGTWGWILLGVIWTLAVLGIVMKTTPLGFRFHRISVALYLLMGWLIVIAVEPLMNSLTRFELSWLVAGGLLYTLGVPFYLWKSRPYSHAIWHVFVLAGVACHFVAIMSTMSNTV
jgi:hemolysin III